MEYKVMAFKNEKKVYDNTMTGTKEEIVTALHKMESELYGFNSSTQEGYERMFKDLKYGNYIMVKLPGDTAWVNSFNVQHFLEGGE